MSTALVTLTGASEAPVIHIGSQALSAMRRHVIAGDRMEGGKRAEVGGVLFGHVASDSDAGSVEIRAIRRLPCEHLIGAPFVLSVDDENKLAQMLHAPETDPELAGMVPLGWYYSHTRTEPCLVYRDVALHDRYFPKAVNPILLVQPARGESIEIVSFLRGADGHLDRCSEDRIEIGEDLKVSQRRGSKWKWPALPADWRRPAAVLSVLAIAGLTAVGVYRFGPELFNQGKTTSGSAHLLTLEARPENGNVLVSWRESAPWGRRFEKAWVDISDGARNSRFPITQSMAARGMMIYNPVSENVKVVLGIERDGQDIERESATVRSGLTPIQPPPADTLLASRKGDRKSSSVIQVAPNEEILQLRKQVQDLAARNQRLEMTVGVLRSRHEVNLAQVHQ